MMFLIFSSLGQKQFKIFLYSVARIFSVTREHMHPHYINKQRAKNSHSSLDYTEKSRKNNGEIPNAADQYL